MTTNLFVIANVKQLRTGGSFRISLPIFPNILGCWRPKFTIFLTVFTIGLSLARFLEGQRNFGGGEVESPNPSLGTPLPCGGF